MKIENLVAGALLGAVVGFVITRQRIGSLGMAAPGAALCAYSLYGVAPAVVAGIAAVYGGLIGGGGDN